ncbi:type II secretion system F family protein [uncultured Enterovirga sp.]|uniref:type II secretion system F family protein n=1 Tax=uncultured Enterovirga sp. TaxID=2026352 RepID=UPI0035CC9F5C
MSEPWVLYLLVFLLVSVAAYGVQQGVGRAAASNRQKRRRVDSLEVAAAPEPSDTLRRRTGRFGGSAPARSLAKLVVQSGLTLSGPAWALIALSLVIALYMLLPVADRSLRLVAAILGAALLAWLWLRIQRARRMARFGEQLPEVIDVIVRSLRAGHPLAMSLMLVAREMPEPAGPEFALVVDEVNYGRSLTDAMDTLHQRVGYPELRFFVAAIAIAHQTGGNLGEILYRLSRLLRDRFRLARRIRALSAEGRFSGYALSVMPVALFGLINVVSASYYTDFWASPSSVPVMSVCLAMLVVGNLIIYRLVNFKV